MARRRGIERCDDNLWVFVDDIGAWNHPRLHAHMPCDRHLGARRQSLRINLLCQVCKCDAIEESCNRFPSAALGAVHVFVACYGQSYVWQPAYRCRIGGSTGQPAADGDAIDVTCQFRLPVLAGPKAP